MENRKNTELERIIKYVKDYWQLSLNEHDILDDFLTVLLDRDEERLKQVGYLLNDEITSLLGRLNDREVAEYASNELNLIPKDSEDDLIDALDDLNYNWSDQVELCEHKEILEDHGYTVEEDGFEVYNIVEESQFEEWRELFVKLSVQERDNILKEKLC